MSNKTILAALAAAVVCTGTSWGVTDAVYTNAGISTGHTWGDPANWTDADGAPLGVAPTNAASQFAVKFVAPDSSKTYSGQLGKRSRMTTGVFTGGDSSCHLEYPAVDPAVDSVAGLTGPWDTWRWTIQFTTYLSYKCQDFKRTFSVRDPNGFEGGWTVNDAKATIKLEPTPEDPSFVPTLHALGAEARPYLDVADKGAVGIVSSEGTLVKKGAGVLRVGETQGENSRFVVEGGTLTFEGTDGGAEVAALLRDAALWLDASDAASLETQEDLVYHDGKTRTGVLQWNDCRGNGRYGYFEKTYSCWDPKWLMAYADAPFVCAEKSPTGLPLVDFGSKASEAGAFGPSNCWLRLDSAVKNVREAFYVVQTPKTAGQKTVLGTVDLTGMSFLSDGTSRLFAPYEQGRLAREGDFMLNGEISSIPEADAQIEKALTNLVVISDGVSTNCAGGGARVQMLASDRYYTSRSGGMRLGEVLLFTNALTRTQRLRINRHLVNKWLGKSNAVDAGAVFMNAAQKVGVSEGRTARVETLRAVKGFTKTGAGTLEIGVYEGDRKAVHVEEGAVGFAAAPRTPSTDAPAADPYVWLDANDLDKFATKTFDGYDHTYITEWADHRADSAVKALAVSNVPPRMPWIEADSVTGKRVVNLGTESKVTQSFLALPTWGADGGVGTGSPKTDDTYAGFIVFRPLVQKSSRNYFGCSNLELFRNSQVTLLSSSYCDNYSPASYWSINGMPIDPWSSTQCTPLLQQTNDLLVVAFRSATPRTVNSITKDRWHEQHPACGDIAVCEFITYHRPLTLDEVHDTEAYLLKKWKNAAHPFAAAPALPLTYASDATVALVDDANATYTITGGNGELEKRAGAGTATVHAGTDAVAKRIAVSSGGLALKVDPFYDALFHLDASDASTLTMEETERTIGSNTEIVTNVTAWADVRGNGFVASSTVLGSKWTKADAASAATAFPNNPYPTFVMTHPTYRMRETAEGVVRPAVCFGHRRNIYTYRDYPNDTTSLDAAAMTFSSQFSTMRDSFIVFREIQAGADYWGHEGGGVDRSHYWRSGNSAMFGSYASANVKNGYIARDRAPIAYTEKLGTGVFHLITLSPLGNTYVEALGQERNCNAGGGDVCEAVGFDRVLSEAERDFAERWLTAKWFATCDFPGVDVEEIALAGGTTLSADASLTTKTLALSGGAAQVTCTKLAVAAGGTLEVAVAADGSLPSFAVDGTLALPDDLTVEVDVTAAKPALGRHVLATGVTLADLTKVTLTMPALGHGHRGKLELKDGALVLHVYELGTTLIVR